MSVLGQHMIRILKCDKRYFTLTEKRVNELERVVFENVQGLMREYDEQREKYIYSLPVENGLLQFESKNKADALCKLIIRIPLLHEPVRKRYNELIEDRFKSKRDRREEKAEARYQRRLALIRKLNSQEY